MKHPTLSAPIRGLAGHLVTADARKLAGLGHIDDRRIGWRVAGRLRPGPVLEWTPASPGRFVAHVEAEGRRLGGVEIRVGLRPADLVERREAFNFFFCLILRDGARVRFLPLFAPGREGKSEAVPLGGGKGGRSALAGELGKGHPALAAWARRQTAIYRRRILPRPFFDAGRVVDGLYAVFPNDLVYLGGARPVAEAVAELKAVLAKVRGGREGGGKLLRRVEKAVVGLKPFEYRYSSQKLWARGGPRTQAANRFVFRAVAPLIQAACRFAAAVGLRVGPGTATAIVTVNALNGTVATRFLDSRAGVSRNLVSGFDVLLRPDQLHTLGSRLAGRGVDPVTFPGFTNRAQTFLAPGGGSVTALGLNAMGRPGFNAAAADEGGESNPAGDVKANGVDFGGKIWVQGSDGTTVGFSKDANGDPVVHVTGTTDDGGIIVTGDETVIDFNDPSDDEGGFGGEDPGTGGTDGGTNGGDGTDGGSPPNGGSGGGTDGGTQPDNGGGDDGTDSGGDDSGGDDSGGDDSGGDDSGGTDGGDDSGGGPTSGDPTASMPAPDDGGGGGDGGTDSGQPQGGGSGATGGRGPAGDPLDPDGAGSSRNPIVLGRVGVITIGGGYTDPAPSDGTEAGGGGGGGSIRVVPGGGVSDPPDEGGGGGFGFWGTAMPPVGGGVDPRQATLGSHGTGNGSRTNFMHGAVTVTAYSGPDPRGVATDGLVGCGLVEPGSGPKP